MSSALHLLVLCLTLFTAALASNVGAIRPAAAAATLRQVHTLSRHGDRNPGGTYPNDPHAQYPWPGGYGALNEHGYQQTNRMGITLGQRYERLLQPNAAGRIGPERVKVHSSWSHRCQMTAASILLGMIPPVPNAIEVQTVPENTDALLRQDRLCLRYDVELERIQNAEWNERRERIYQYVAESIGRNVTKPRDIEILYGILNMQRDAGLELPAWTNGVFPELLKPLAELSYLLYTATPYMRRMRGGGLLTKWLGSALALSEAQLRPEEDLVMVYAAHQHTIVNTLRGMGVMEQLEEMPTYAATLVMELHEVPELRDVNGDEWEVRFYYYADSEVSDPQPLELVDCEAPCSLGRFVDSMQPVLFELEDFEELCAGVED